MVYRSIGHRLYYSQNLLSSNIYWKNGRQKTTMGGLHNAQQNNPNAPSIKRRIKKPIP